MKFLGRFRGLAVDKDKPAIDEFLHARAREFRAMGGHEPVEPCPSVSSYRQKFMNLGLGLSRHRPIVAGCREGYILKGNAGEDQEVRRTERRGLQLCGMGGANATI